MTDYDKQLIAQAESTRRWDYRDIDRLIARAQSREAREQLEAIQWRLIDSIRETI